MAPEHGPTARLVYENWHDAHGVDTDADGPWHRLIKAYLDPQRDLQGKRILGIDSDGVGHYFLFPRMLPRQITILDNARFLMRWLALHSLVVAEKAFANRRP